MRRQGGLVLLLLLLVAVNLPLAHLAWTGWRLDRSGTDVTATVVDAAPVDDGGAVDFRLDEAVDPDQRTWSTRLDAAAYAAAESSRRLEVRVLPDDVSVQRVPGQTGSGLVVALTVLADLFLAAALLLRRLRRPLRPVGLVALEDVVPPAPGAPASSFEELPDDTYLVTGRVHRLRRTGLVLRVEDRLVRLDLDGHENHVAQGQPARVRARLDRPLTDSDA